MATILDSDIFTFDSQQAWEDWLLDNHTRIKGVWLRMAKKSAPNRTVNYDEALDSSLCFGWIDGQRKGLDEFYFLQKYTPRRSKSLWSQRNVEKAMQLIEKGRMKPPGLAEIQAAQNDGRWQSAYDSPKHMVIPEDFLKALGENPGAMNFYQKLDKSSRFLIGLRLQTARTPETRLKRIHRIINALEVGKKPS